MTEHRPPREILRYNANERTNHWLVAISFVLAGLSGLALYHPAMSWLYALFGGGPWTRILHPFIGVFMFVVFFLFAARMWGSNRIDARDRQWLRQIDDVAAGREDKLPEVGRYNAGQKLLFWGIMGLITLLLISGVVIWRPYFAPLFSIPTIRIGLFVHALAGVLLMLLIIGHIYLAFWVKGSVDSMSTGYVSRKWARTHHPRWYRQVTGDSARKERP